MTNKEWLFSLDNTTLAKFLINEIPSIGSCWTVSTYGVEVWLANEHYDNTTLKEINDDTNKK